MCVLNDQTDLGPKSPRALLVGILRPTGAWLGRGALCRVYRCQAAGTSADVISRCSCSSRLYCSAHHVSLSPIILIPSTLLTVIWLLAI